DQGGLARAVRADEEAQLALGDGEVDAVERAEAVEDHRQIADLQQRLRRAAGSVAAHAASFASRAAHPARARRRSRASASRAAASSPATPPGTRVMTRMNSAPCR